jgi:hypothetical protein
MNDTRTIGTRVASLPMRSAKLVVLSTMVALATPAPCAARDDPGAAIRRHADTPMDQEMQALRDELDRLDAQMAQLSHSTDPDQRHRLMTLHLDSARRTLTRVHAMELQMIDRVRRGRVVSDMARADRQRLLAAQSAMLLEMLEQTVGRAERGRP